MSLDLIPNRAAPPGLIAHLAHTSADAYYGTAGSVTLGMREAANTINDHLIAYNQDETSGSRLQARLILAILRNDNIYIAQCGIGQSILIRPNQVTRLISEEASQRPLGMATSPFLRFFHLEVKATDLLILTTDDPPSWLDASLANLAGLNPVQAVERLLPEINRDITGMIIGITPAGEETHSPPKPLDVPRSGFSKPSASVGRRAPRKEPGKTPIARKSSGLRGLSQSLSKGIRSCLSALSYSIAKTMARLSPGLSEPLTGMYSPRILALTAILVPIFVALIGGLVYFRLGRKQQFDLNISEARSAIESAQRMASEDEARQAWSNALASLEQAGLYGSSGEADQLRQKAQTELDRIDMIVRLDFQPILSGGFGSGVRLSALAASSTDLYILDERNHAIWHVWWTGRNFDRDGNFICLPAADSATMSFPIDLAIVPEPSALGTESLIAIDEAGNLIYCAPDKEPATARLAPPEAGWGKIRAIEIYNNRLYLLDPLANAVWIYDARDGFISGNPTAYFSDSPPDLSKAIDLVGTQEGLLILFADGHLERCQREGDASQSGETAMAGGCETLSYIDERTGQREDNPVLKMTPTEMVYSPPPEPSLYFLDPSSGSVFQFSLRLIYQAQYLPKTAFGDNLMAFSIGPPNHLYVAAGSQVFHVQLGR